MKILAFDTETTGLLDNPQASIVEMAYAVYDTTADRILKCKSLLVNTLTDENKLSTEAASVNGLSNELIISEGYSPEPVFNKLRIQIIKCDAVLAFNAPFDKGMAERAFVNYNIAAPTKPWICAQRDIVYPDFVRGKNQTHIAADLDFLNPFPHVAVGDIFTMLKICQSLDIDWPKLVELSQIPKIKVKAHVSFERKDEAKELNFIFNGDKKTWWKEIRETEFEELTKKAKFKITKYIERK